MEKAEGAAAGGAEPAAVTQTYYACFCRADQLAEGLFEGLLGGLDPIRQEKTMARRRREDRLLSLAVGLLLRRCLRRWGIAEAPAYDGQGKPVIPGHPEVFVSATHCWPYAGAIISSSPCGIDLERRRPVEAVVGRWFLPEEQALCRGDPAVAMDIWCRKECIIKCFGLRDWKRLDTGILPEGYVFAGVPLTGFSFQTLTRGNAGEVEQVTMEKLKVEN